MNDRFLFDHHQLGCVLTIVVSAGLGLFSLLRGWREQISRRFGIYSLLIAAWCFFYFQMMISVDDQWALFCGRFLHFFSAFIPATFLHFVQQLLGTTEEKKSVRWRRVFYGMGVGFVLICFHPLFVTKVGPFENFRNYVKWGPLYYPFFIAFVGGIISVFIILIREYLGASGRRKIQLSYVIVAYGIGYLGGISVFLPAFDISAPWWGIYCIALAHIFLLYAILKHQLLNFRIFLRRAALIALIYGSLAAISAFSFFYFQAPSQFLEVLIAGGVLSFGPFLYANIIRKSAFFHEHTIAGLTHELKSPLGVIDSATAALLDDMNNPNIDKEKITHYLALIQNNTSRLQMFVQNLLHVAIDQGNDIAIAPKPCDLASIVQSAIHYRTAEADRKNITLNYQGPNTAAVTADATKIDQVISNILSNALKFSENGQITIEISQANKDWICAIHDQGCGIAPENLKKIFLKFFQGRPGSKGTGLGLTIAKAWVEAHGGKIWAESEGEGKGTTVRFTLPV